MNLASIFGGAIVPPEDFAERVYSPEFQLIEKMLDLGIDPPDNIEFTGKIIRFGKDKSCWYVAYSDNICAGAFGDWRTGVESTWRQDVGRRLTDQEVKEWSARITKIKSQRDDEEMVKHAEAALECRALFKEADKAVSHPYLIKKQVLPHKAKIASDGRLMIPLYSIDGSIQSLQYIDDVGNKRFYYGGKVTGNFGVVGKVTSTIYLVEGFATAATVHQVTGMFCVVAFSANNLLAVANNIKSKFTEATIVIVGDNDASGVGQKSATDAAKAIECECIIPPDEGDVNDYVNAGGDLNYLLNKNAWLVPADIFCDSDEHINWLIAGYLQSNALIMVHGKSGSGKTFLVLDMALHLASGMITWNNKKTKPCPVVYLAGEGHRGLKGRILAWKHHHGVADLNMWVSKSACDLDKGEGLQATLKGIASLPSIPGLVVIDTLHRFMTGDENHSQDAKKILDACTAIQNKFNCTVLLVHHTGHAVAKRGRGSSSWRGAMDIESSVEIIEQSNAEFINLSQVKNKDSARAKDINFRLVPEIIPGRIDEYGNQVMSAVVEMSDVVLEKSDNEDDAGERTVKEPPVSKHTNHLNTLRNAWLNGDRQLVNGIPYITRQELRDQLILEGGKPATADSYVRPSSKAGPIYPLINGQEIKPHQEGWTLVNLVQSSIWIQVARAKKTE